MSFRQRIYVALHCAQFTKRIVNWQNYRSPCLKSRYASMRISSYCSCDGSENILLSIESASVFGFRVESHFREVVWWLLWTISCQIFSFSDVNCTNAVHALSIVCIYLRFRIVLVTKVSGSRQDSYLQYAMTKFQMLSLELREFCHCGNVIML